MYNEQLYRMLLPFFALFGKDKYRNIATLVPTYDVWIFGYHRVGLRICRALQEKGIKFAVVDFNPDAIRLARKKGIPTYFGDAADVEFLHELPLEVAKMVISTLPETDDQKTLIHHVATRNSGAKIIANTYNTASVADLYAAGAHYVLVPHMVGGAWMANILSGKPWTARTFEKLRKEQSEEFALRFT
jgi:voltage-gated potassium channel Kch